uniref:DsbC family protein n=1 Tax=Polynucleobacter sp. TaxID=2029855 RepID=UPI0040489547
MKLFKTINLVCAMSAASMFLSFSVNAQGSSEAKIKTEMQKQLGERAKIDAVRTTPVAGLYEVTIGNDIVYTDASGRYLIQGEVVDLKTGKNLTEQRSNDLNRIRWADLPLNDAIKVVRGKGTRQVAVFADPNCGFCKRLEKGFEQLDNVTIYTFLVPLLSADSLTKSQQIWCSSDKVKAWTDWMINNQAPTGKGDCGNPLDRNTALTRKLGITGTPAIFFTDGSRVNGAIPMDQIEKKLK